MSKRQRLSGAAYKNLREKKEEEGKRAAKRFHQLMGFSDTPSVPSGKQGDQPQCDISLEIDVQAATSSEPPNNQDQPSSTSQSHPPTHHPQSLFNDSGNWPVPMTDNLRIELIKRGPSHLKNMNGPFPADSNNRSMSKVWYFKILENGEKIERSWLIFSPSKCSLHCFCCRLFNNISSAFGKEGFFAWRKLNPRVPEHENSSYHTRCFEQWKELSMRLQLNATIDNAHQLQIKHATAKWKEIPRRIYDCIMFLAKQDLAFRGHRENLNEKAGLAGNCGNFLELIKLMGKYDPVIREHLTKIRMTDKISTMYLSMSPNIQNEFITLIGCNVQKCIIDNVSSAKYFAIIFDSTPDISHIDQMSQVIRYVSIKDGNVEVKESFVDFIKLEGKTAEAVTDLIVTKLREDGLDIQNCYGQGYDNVATMAGIHLGVQRRILDVSKHAVFIPCNNHSLNLAGVHAAGLSPNAVTFFGTIERIFVYFSSSTHRWDVLTKHSKITVKRVSDTRWSAKYDAVSSLKKNLTHVVSALEELSEGVSENLDTKGDAEALLTSIMSYTFIVYLFFWDPVLKEINDAQMISYIFKERDLLWTSVH